MSLGCRPGECAAHPADPGLRRPELGKLPSFNSPPWRRAAGLVTEALAGREEVLAGVAPLGLPCRTARRGRSEVPGRDPWLLPPPWPGRALSREAGRLPCSGIHMMRQVLSCCPCMH